MKRINSIHVNKSETPEMTAWILTIPWQPIEPITGRSQPIDLSSIGIRDVFLSYCMEKGGLERTRVAHDASLGAEHVPRYLHRDKKAKAVPSSDLFFSAFR